MPFVSYFLRLLQLKSSTVSVVFDFNAPPNDVAPKSLMRLSVDLVRMKKSELMIHPICLLFLLSSRARSSIVSVVFDFNASLNDVAPMFPIKPTVCLMRMEKSGLLMDVICAVSFCFHLSD